MKKSSNILFVLVIAIPMVLPAWFLVRQQTLREEAKQKLKTGLLRTIRVEKNQLVWVKPGKEIRTRGHLFDVKHITDKGAWFEVTGLYDEQEDLLHQQLGHWQHHQDKQNNRLLSALFSQLLFTEPPFTAGVAAPPVLSADFNEYKNQRYVNPSAPLLSPPPDYC